MGSATTITCRVSANGPGLRFMAKLDDHVFFQGDPYGDHSLEVALQEDDSAHTLRFELHGKGPEHTKVAEDGAIQEDILVAVQDIAFAGIRLGHLFVEKAVYNHDFNGTASAVSEKFFGTMGCNGVVSLDFTTPIYLWLLENM